MNKIYEDAYKIFQKTCQFEKDANHILPDEWMSMSDDSMKADILSQEEFINKIKIDGEFAKKWEIKIEERELSLEDRYGLIRANGLYPKYSFEIEDGKPVQNKVSESEYYNKHNIPTKLITITYNNETIESYE